MITINANINRKVPGKEDYSSQGFSCSITAEVDDSVLRDPKTLQKKLDYLYDQCSLSVERQIQQGRPSQPPAAPQKPPQGDNRVKTQQRSGGNGNNRKRGSNARPMTEKQQSYIEDLAVNVNLNADGLNALCVKMFNSDFDVLSSLDASALLSTLKDVQSGSLSLASL